MTPRVYKRIIVKLGTSVLTGGTPRLNRSHMIELVRQCAVLHREGHDVIVVTSGAIAAGRQRLGWPELAPSVSTKQMLAAVGQSRLMWAWESLFDIYEINVGQVLLTRADVRHRGRFLNARDTLLALLEHRIVPIINENDAVATREIKVGDNDNLSALVALLSDANLLLLLTDQEGLYTADPRKHPEAQLIPEVDDINDELRALAGGSVSGLGTGGMTTKLQAAEIARRAGADVIIAAGHAPEVILHAARGESIGTLFRATRNPLENRKRWLVAGGPGGRLFVDSGAARALRERGSSLLPAGITRVEGEFDRGDPVVIVGPDGAELARGVTRYNSRDLSRILGCRSEDIESCLGYAYGAVAVHRNDLILV